MDNVRESEVSCGGMLGQWPKTSKRYIQQTSRIRTLFNSDCLLLSMHLVYTAR
jgi:hypothetical protein